MLGEVVVGLGVPPLPAGAHAVGRGDVDPSYPHTLGITVDGHAQHPTYVRKASFLTPGSILSDTWQHPDLIGWGMVRLERHQSHPLWPGAVGPSPGGAARNPGP